MKRIYLCRHGKTPWNAERRIQGLTDIELSNEGHKQAEWLAQFIKAQAKDPIRIVSSPLLRATQTAQHIADALGVPVELDNRIIEINTGKFTGMKLDDLKDDPEWQAHLVNPWHTGYGPTGEPAEAVRDRVMGLIREAQQSDDPRDLLIVTHASPVRHAIMAMMDIPHEHLYHIVVHNASASLFELREDFYKCVFLNANSAWGTTTII